MKIVLLYATCFSLVACDSKQRSEPAQDSSAQQTPNSSSHTPAALPPRSRSRSEKHEATAKAEKLTAQLAEIPDMQTKRDLFADILLTLPNEDHSIAIQAIIDDLHAPASARLLTEYLEFSEMLDPALQLPAYARLLQEKEVSPLQRAAMEQQLREQLKITSDSPILDWKPLITAFLKTQPGLIDDSE